MQVLLRFGSEHHLTVEFQAVAVGIQQVEAIRHDMVSGHLDLDAAVLEQSVELLKLHWPPLNLYGRMCNSGTSNGLVVGDLDHSQVMVVLPKRQERHLHLFQERHELHPEGFCVERDRSLRVPYPKHRVSDTCDLAHVSLPPVPETSCSCATASMA